MELDNLEEELRRLPTSLWLMLMLGMALIGLMLGLILGLMLGMTLRLWRTVESIREFADVGFFTRELLDLNFLMLALLALLVLTQGALGLGFGLVLKRLESVQGILLGVALSQGILLGMLLGIALVNSFGVWGITLGLLGMLLILGMALLSSKVEAVLENMGLNRHLEWLLGMIGWLLVMMGVLMVLLLLTVPRL